MLAQLEGEREQTGIVLVAGGAPVSRIPDAAETPSPALTLDLERSLRAEKPLAPRKADRVHTLNLTGEMAGYVWSINNVAWNKDVPPLAVAEGERVELVFVNQTPMPHPMHLHGHEFQVVEIDGERFSGAVRDTVLVTPGRRVVVAFDANNPGWWALHCHLLYHMEAGMFTTIKYAVEGRASAPFGFSWLGVVSLQKTPNYGAWILLDFLGFSRPNRDLSIGYKGFSVKNFSSRFFRSIRSVSMGNAQSRRRGRQDCSRSKPIPISDFLQWIVVGAAGGRLTQRQLL